MKKGILDFYNENMEMEQKFPDLSLNGDEIKPSIEALKIIIIYLIIGCLWILLSDRILGKVVHNPKIYEQIQLYKGWFYVFATGIGFYFVIKKSLKLFKKAADRIAVGYEELSATHEELIALDEELSQQFTELENNRGALIISNQRYELAVEGAHDGIWDWDINNDTYFNSIQWKKSVNLEVDSYDENIESWKALLHPDDCQQTLENLSNYLENKEGVYENTYRLRCKNGIYRWIQSRGKAIWDNKGKPIRIAGSHTDITEQIELQEKIIKEMEFSESIVHEAPMIIVVADKYGKITQYNPYAEEKTGYPRDYVIGKNCRGFLKPDSDKEDMLGPLDKSSEQLMNFETNIRCKNGKMITVLWNTNLLQDQEGETQGIIYMGLDITERRGMEKELKNLAYYDSLTGLPNRTKLENATIKQIKQVELNNKKFAFIYLDIDNFKHINDTMGHAAGDELIKFVSNKLSENIKTPNMVARIGGDEFTILLNEAENTEQAIQFMEKLLEKLRSPWILGKKKFFITVSAGIAVYPEHGTDLAELMQNADTAMFHRKENSKDGYCVYASDMREKAWNYIQMYNQLKTAIEKEEFFLYYQPQVDLKSGKVQGVEALIRWIHPERGFIPPAEFIPFSEKTGQISQIGDWVVKTACRQKKVWEDKGNPDVKMAINLSGKSLTQDGLVDMIQQIIDKYNIDTNTIEFEITETAVMADLNKSIEVLNKLKGLGVTIALDDFGTGYSSLTYLQKLPIDILKMDREFIINLINSEEDTYIFKSIVGLAHDLGLKVIAEGVETKEQLAFLSEFECDIVQGYYFGKPAEASKIEKLFG